MSILLALEVDMFNYYVSCSNAKADSISDSITCKYVRYVNKIQKDRLKPFFLSSKHQSRLPSDVSVPAGSTMPRR